MGKRGQNEGTIRKRKDGRWEARAIIGRTIGWSEENLELI